MFFENLDYYILGEVVTVIVSVLLLYNVFASFSPYERRHRLFMYACVGCFLSALFDIISVFTNTYYTQVNQTLSFLVSTLYYVFLLIVPVAMAGYSLELAYAYREKTHPLYPALWVIYCLYLVVLIVNIFTGIVFYTDAINGYQYGPCKNITYILAIFYMAIIELVTCTHKKNMATRMFLSMILYPVIALCVLAFQFFFPKVLLTGASSLAALLLAYMTIQSDMLEFDLVTGLMTQHKLEKHVQLKNNSGVLFVFSIDNIQTIQSNMEASDFNTMLLLLGRQFTKRFERRCYHIATNRFAAIADTKELVEKYAAEVYKVIEDANQDTSAHKLPVPLECYSVGVEFAKGPKSFNNVMDIVNNLLTKAKRTSCKQLLFCDESVLLDLERKRIIFQILKRELTFESHQYQVWFQPIYSVKENKFVYMEALSRLNGTELGDISPAEFVQVAETKGLIEKLGMVAFEKICKFIADNRNLVNAVSVNFSVYQMTNPNIVDYVLKTIAKFGLNPNNIIMEITESIFIDNYEVVYKNMTELTQAGVKFYLDDFGTGYSNLANVVKLPFSTVKMDRSLVLAMEESAKNVVLFRNLVSTFKDAELEILVEGIETQNQNYLVTTAGADYIQGYLYSRPLPPEQCLELLKLRK